MCGRVWVGAVPVCPQFMGTFLLFFRIPSLKARKKGDHFSAAELDVRSWCQLRTQNVEGMGGGG